MATLFSRKPTKALTPESAWRHTGLEWLKIRFGRNLWHYRTVAGITQRLGVLDDHFIVCGVPVQVEWKRPDGKYRRDTKTYAAQEREIEAVRQAGGRAGFVESWEDLEALVDGIPCVQQSMLSARRVNR
jgi:hypothetical protein